MAAKDYVFQEGCLGGIYLAKKIKSKKLMSEDRRKVEEWEIIALFEKYLRRRCQELGDNEIVITSGDKKIFEAKLLDNKEDQ